MVLCKRSPLFLRGVNAKRPNIDKRDMHINETLFPSAKMIKYMANYFEDNSTVASVHIQTTYDS